MKSTLAVASLALLIASPVMAETAVPVTAPTTVPAATVSTPAPSVASVKDEAGKVGGDMVKGEVAKSDAVKSGGETAGSIKQGVSDTKTEVGSIKGSIKEKTGEIKSSGKVLNAEQAKLTKGVTDGVKGGIDAQKVKAQDSIMPVVTPATTPTTAH